jgi:hypothetical protein
MPGDKHTPLARDPDEPFALQLEWLANRYNPGYFLGGTLRPELNVASLGWHAKRVAGVLPFSSGMALLGTSLFVAVAAGGVLPDPSVAFGLLQVLAGVRIWRAAAAQDSRSGREGAGEAMKLLQAATMVVLGVVLVSVVGIVALAGLCVAVAVSRGEAGLGAAICVIIAIAAARRARHRTTGR